jgi:hypothetical protein
LPIPRGRRVWLWLAGAVVACSLHAPEAARAHGDGSDHARSDAFWARRARENEARGAAPPFSAPAAAAPAASQLQTLGRWAPARAWPHIPVSAANLPDGRVLTFASNQRNRFPSGVEFTYAAAWDPVSESIDEINHAQHDMFCGHLVMLEDGRVFINGGRNTVPLTSVFDFQNDQWSLIDPMNRGRWYPTSVALSDGQVFTALGNGGGDIAEVWAPGSGWRDLPGISLAGLMQGLGFETNWWPFLHLDPTGRLFHYGPLPDMHRIDPNGSGSIENLGPWMASNRWYPKHGAVVMYDEGRILVAGGDSDGAQDTGSTNRALTIDINSANPSVTEIAPMSFARRFSNPVMLPNGEVLVVGGNTSGEKFSDLGTVLTPEIWNPVSGAWRSVASMTVPRNYHSVALLLLDGRVFSGGGGLCDCSADHQDVEIYSPPYLFAADGSPAPRPSISQAPAQVRNGQTFAVQASAGLDHFSLIKMSATTHAVNTDLRFLRPPFASLGGGSYEISAPSNRDVLTPGYWMLFGLDAAGVPSPAHVLQVTTAGAPDVANPGPQTSAEGYDVVLVVAASDPDGDPLEFVANGLPPGLTLDPQSGVVSGTIADGAAGSYVVGVEVSDAVGPTSIHFTWTVHPGGLGSGAILREWWTGIPGTAVTSLTGAPGYPDAPSGSNLLSAFEAPTDWADEYGTRVRGYLHAPLTGSYRFWIASDDNAELWLSSDDSPGNASRIARVPGWTTSRLWNKYPEQASAAIPLVAGARYYVEALQKEHQGGDNLAVAWEIPGQGTGPVLIDGLYLSPPAFAPSVDPIPDQQSFEGDAVSLQAQASDPNGDPLAWSALGLPPDLAIDPVGGTITGGVAVPAAGSYVVTVSAEDPSGWSDSTVFGWSVLPLGANPVGELRRGIACQDGASGGGYLMYSAEDVRTRFSPVPISQNSQHFVCVVLIGGQWHYDNNSVYTPFTPLASDVLVAQVDFDADSVTGLAGQQGVLNGIRLGYESGDLGFAANQYNGVFDSGEFTISGTFFVSHAAVCGDGVVDPGEDCDGSPCCALDCGFEPPGAACSDADLCTAADACDGAGSCVPGAPVACDDGNPCTAEACDALFGCTSAAVATPACGGPAPQVPAAPRGALLALAALLLAAGRAAGRRRPAPGH